MVSKANVSSDVEQLALRIAGRVEASLGTKYGEFPRVRSLSSSELYEHSRALEVKRHGFTWDRAREARILLRSITHFYEEKAFKDGMNLLKSKYASALRQDSDLRQQFQQAQALQFTNAFGFYMPEVHEILVHKNYDPGVSPQFKNDPAFGADITHLIPELSKDPDLIFQLSGQRTTAQDAVRTLLGESEDVGLTHELMHGLRRNMFGSYTAENWSGSDMDEVSIGSSLHSLSRGFAMDVMIEGHADYLTYLFYRTIVESKPELLRIDPMPYSQMHIFERKHDCDVGGFSFLKSAKIANKIEERHLICIKGIMDALPPSVAAEVKKRSQVYEQRISPFQGEDFFGELKDYFTPKDKRTANAGKGPRGSFRPEIGFARMFGLLDVVAEIYSDMERGRVSLERKKAVFDLSNSSHAYGLGFMYLFYLHHTHGKDLPMQDFIRKVSVYTPQDLASISWRNMGAMLSSNPQPKRSAIEEVYWN